MITYTSKDKPLVSDQPNGQSTTFEHRDGYIYYGSVVKLVDSVNNISLPKMRIRKVDKNNSITDRECDDEPVSQLHRVSFQFLDSPDQASYLSLAGEKIIQQKVSSTD